MKPHAIIRAMNAERKKKSEDGVLKLMKWVHSWTLKRVAQKWKGNQERVASWKSNEEACFQITCVQGFW